MVRFIEYSDFFELLKHIRVYEKGVSYEHQFRKILRFYYSVYKTIPVEIVRDSDVEALLELLSTNGSHVEVKVAPVKKDKTSREFSKLINNCFTPQELGSILLNVLSKQSVKNIDKGIVVNLFLELNNNLDFVKVLSRGRGRNDVRDLLFYFHTQVQNKPKPFCKAVKEHYPNLLNSVKVRLKYNKVCGSPKSKKKVFFKTKKKRRKATSKNHKS